MSGPKPRQQRSRSPKDKFGSAEGGTTGEAAKPVEEQAKYAGVNPAYVVFDEFGDVDDEIFNEGENDDGIDS